ncbi:MAG: enhanced serine sensitivity protein SseB C-terminal domain-containing protein [Cocleimonas sp.]|nr:enhanced serine sensitivity protein SseB C-terminal domain-containing protein [Cocleimonas sp.]
MLLPSNPLEQALFNSASDNSLLSTFYDLLMASNVFILGSIIDKQDGTFNINEDQEFDIQHWENEEDNSPVIPFFTSMQMLQKAIPEDSAYIEIPATSFMEMTLGVSLVLNPNTDYGVELDFADVSSLLNVNPEEMLDDQQSEGLGNMEEVEEGEMFLGILDHRPEDLCKAMSNVFSNFPEVETAYMAAIHVPSESKEAHLLVGIEGKGDLDTAIPTIANDIPEKANDSDYEMFDFYIMSDDDPEEISQFLKENNTAFYHVNSTKVH